VPATPPAPAPPGDAAAPSNVPEQLVPDAPALAPVPGVPGPAATVVMLTSLSVRIVEPLAKMP